MRRFVRPSLFVVPRSPWQGGLLIVLLASFLALGLLSARDSAASGPFPLNGKLTATKIWFDGACNPGSMASNSSLPASGGPVGGVVIQTTGSVFGCLATQCAPQNLLVDSEIVAYSNLGAMTTADLPASYTGSFVIQDVPAVPGAPPDVPDCPAQVDVAEFPTSGSVFIGTEEVTYNNRNGNTINITGREGGGGSLHPAGSYVRLQSQLRIKGVPGSSNQTGRHLPSYIGGPDSTQAAHAYGSSVHSPRTYMSCRALLQEPNGTAQEGSRSRCYFVFEPGYNSGSCPTPPTAPTDACYFPDGAVPPDTVQPLRTGYYHDLSTGTVAPAGANETLTLFTSFSGATCFEEIPGLLWVKLRSDITVDKNFTDNDTDDGAFQIQAYLSFADCQAGTSVANIQGGSLGIVNNLKSTQLPLNTDTDGDGCPDAKELVGGMSEGGGGNRDPFNPYDYFNPSHDHQNRVDDILRVVGQYFKDDTDGNPGLYPYSANYNPDTDRTALGPSAWNVGRPNGQQRVDDILAMVKQYFHDCS